MTPEHLDRWSAWQLARREYEQAASDDEETARATYAEATAGYQQWLMDVGEWHYPTAHVVCETRLIQDLGKLMRRKTTTATLARPGPTE